MLATAKQDSCAGYCVILGYQITGLVAVLSQVGL